MKKKSIILVILTIVFFSFQNTYAQHTVEKQDTTLIPLSTKITYTCPMHSEIISDKPGTCPKCGMELVKLEKGKKQSEPMQHQMGMMMCMPMGDMNQNNNEQKKDNMKMMTGIGIGMGILMVIMMVVILL